MKLSRLKKVFFLHLQHWPMPSTKWRPLVVKWGGVDVKDFRHTFIGENVIFDTNYPQDIHIARGVRITVGSILLTHFMDVSTGTYLRGEIHIGENVHIGCNTVICKPVTIGANSIIGAGSVVTKDIPANEVWAGNPARFIRKRDKNSQND